MENDPIYNNILSIAIPFNNKFIDNPQEFFILTLAGQILMMNIDKLIGLIDNGWV